MGCGGRLQDAERLENGVPRRLDAGNVLAVLGYPQRNFTLAQICSFKPLATKSGVRVVLKMRF